MGAVKFPLMGNFQAMDFCNPPLFGANFLDDKHSDNNDSHVKLRNADILEWPPGL